ncbi:hypothetical protein TNCV_4396401 [Trichonephila clavipes]|uniref:Uncharacterized protein n=1 Tax=Trichonephila clavipes TaxID=2585209 RepID=A0A8X7BEE8_TRICX|nr:hypothetical protein TNCV_4396401 [Trichonephila clavipes]
MFSVGVAELCPASGAWRQNSAQHWGISSVRVAELCPTSESWVTFFLSKIRGVGNKLQKSSQLQYMSPGLVETMSSVKGMSSGRVAEIRSISGVFSEA